MCALLISCHQGAEISCETSVVFERQLVSDSFFKGNTHTHTERSVDSDEFVGDVLQWYIDADYDFVVLTDHDVSSVPGEFSTSANPNEFLVIAGEEISSVANSPTRSSLPVHVNSICSNGTTIGSAEVGGVADTLKFGVDSAIDRAGAIAQVNHPNFQYALEPADILFSERAKLIEIANQHPLANNAGEENRLSSDEIWDEILSAGMEIYGVASDDTHELAPDSRTPPGKGWIEISAHELSADAVCEAMQLGSFYASTGVILGRIAVTDTRIELEIVAAPGGPPTEYVTTFIGGSASVLHTAVGLSSEFELTEYQQYVRAHIRGPGGSQAWVQPQFVKATESCSPSV